MAFGKKYFSSYKSSNNLDYYLEIFLENYTGSALELVMGAGGPVIEYETDQEDRFSPIISSSCKIPYLVENFLDSTFIDDLRNNYQERQVYVHIYRSTQSGSSGVAPLWSGFLVMDIGSGVDKYFPYEEHLKFVDGLSLLKDIDFVDLGVTGGTPPFEERVQGNYAKENMYYGPATYIYWIREILAKSGAALTNQGASQNYGFTTSVNWYNGEMNATGQSSDPLHKTKCAVSMFHRKDDQGVFYPDNCYNVLKELLRHWGARITYWKHEFWIVQIPEYITSESGTISTPVNNNSRLYSNTGAYQGSQNHLGSTYWTRYEQTIQNDKISKLSGTKYDYLPLIKQVNADFLSFSSKSYYGGFPFGSTATTQEVFQGTINSPSAADFLYLSIPLNWTWDLSNAPNFPNGHTNGWWCAIKFNFYASDGTTTYYLQYDSGSGNYFWVDSALWTPLGNRAPKYIISSKLADVTGHIGFEQQIPFEDENGNAISMSGAWSFFLDIEDYGTGNSNPGSFYINFSGYGSPQRMRNPGTAIQLPAGSGVMSGTVSWSNTLVDQQGQVTISSISNPAGFNAGTVNPDIRFATTSPFTGLLQTLNNAQSASNGETFNVINSNTQAKQNSEQYNFGTLLWGDSLEFAPSSLQVFDGSTYVNTEPSGEWGRGVLTGTKTFTKMLIDEFFSGQTKIIISPSMRLAVGVANKNEDQSGTIRPRYVNPIGKLRETRDGTDPEYFFRRGSFYTLLDEWDYEGYQIIRDVPTTTTQSNGMGSMGGSQSGSPAPSGMSPSPMVQALSQNSPLAYIRATIPATGSNVAVNGNFNTAVGWSLGSGWSIDTTAKKAKFAATGSTSELTQSVLTQGLTYQVNFKVEVTAGTLLVKAGSSGTSQSITSSGDYSIYLDCEGSSLIKFQAGTTFTGNITYITLRDQKSLSSVPIESIGTSVFKTGDTFNLINSNDDTILPLTVTSNQGSTDTTISVSSTPLYEDIDNGSYLLINQDDLSEQYQNKTKGTVAGFGIDADGISKGGIEITGWLNSDTMSGAAVTNVPTALSVKNYVDGQVGASDTLAEVLANGNTTGGTDISVNDDDKITFGASGDLQIYHDQNNSYIRDAGVGDLYLQASDNIYFQTYGSGKRWITLNENASVDLFYNDVKKLETTNTGISITGGGVFTGQVTIPATPVASTDAASKSYVDAQVSATDSLQEVTTVGNTTTNSIMIGSSSSPSQLLHIDNPTGASSVLLEGAGGWYSQILFRTNPSAGQGWLLYDYSANVMTFGVNASEKMRLTNSGDLVIGATTGGRKLVIGNLNGAVNDQISFLDGGGTEQATISVETPVANDLLIASKASLRIFTGSVIGGITTIPTNERARITSGGNLLIGTTTTYYAGTLLGVGDTGDSQNGLQITTSTTGNGYILFGDGTGADAYRGEIRYAHSTDTIMIKAGGTNILNLTGTTATFSGQVTIPATPVASTDAASKSYVDAQVGSADTLSEVLANGNTSGANDIIMNNNQEYKGTHTNGATYGLLTLTSGNQIKLGGYEYTTASVIIGGGDNARFNIGLTEKMRLTSTGLGIGTSSPENLFTLVGTAGLTAQRFKEGSTTIGFIGGANGLISGHNGKMMLRAETGLVLSGQGSGTPFILDSSGNITLSGSLTGTTATFSGLVSGITPTAAANFTTKAYVDGQIPTGGPFLPLTGGTLTGDLILGSTSSPVDLYLFGDTTGVSLTWSNADDELQFSDNAKAVFGDSGDLQIYHDQSNSYIKDSGVGELKLLSSALAIQSANGNEYIAYFAGTGGQTASLYAGNSKKFETSSIGANVYGKLLIGTTVDSGEQLQVNGNIGLFSSNDANISRGKIQWSTSQGTSRSFIRVGGSYAANDLEFGTGNAVLGMILHANQGLSIGSGATTIAPSNGLRVTGATTLIDSLTGTTATFSSATDQILNLNSTDSNAVFMAFKRADSRIGYFGFSDTSNNINIGNETTSGKIRFVTNSTTKMSLEANGNVLIGTTTDGGILEVDGTYGDLKIGDPSIGTRISYYDTTRILMNSADIKFYTNSLTERMSLEANGNVLIGTTTDSGEKLNVNGDIKTNNIKVLDGSAASPSILFYNDNDTGFYRNASGETTYTSNGSNKIRLTSSGLEVFSGYLKSTSLDINGNADISGVLYIDNISTRSGTNIDFRHQDGTTKMQLKTATGNLLIGTTTDSGYKLQVTTANNNDGFRLNYPSNNSTQYPFYIGKSDDSNYFRVNSQKIAFKRNGGTSLIKTEGSSNDLTLQSQRHLIFNTSDANERARITSGGNLLLGTTTDSGSKLTVAGNVNLSSTSPILYLANTTSSTGKTWRASSAPNGNFYLTQDGVIDAITLKHTTGNAIFGGSVGIGTSSSQRKLHIHESSGSVYFQMTQGSTGTTSNDGFQIAMGATQVNLINRENGPMLFDTNNSTKMSLLANGNLLIGTTTDDGSSKLQVDGIVKVLHTDSSYAKYRGQGVFFNRATSYLAPEVDNYASLNVGYNGARWGNVLINGAFVKFSNGATESMRISSSSNVLIGTTTDSGAKLYVNGVIRAVGGGIQAAQDYGFTLNDESGSNRYGLKFGAAGSVGGSDLLMLTNRSIYSAATSGGIVTIGGNSSTTGVSEVEIARFDPRVSATSGTQRKVTLDAVLELTAQTDPANPANSKSIIWMDTNGNIKAKMTDSGGTTVTRTIASFE
jgi:hypothetical protein